MIEGDDHTTKGRVISPGSNQGTGRTRNARITRSRSRIFLLSRFREAAEAPSCLSLPDHLLLRRAEARSGEVIHALHEDIHNSFLLEALTAAVSSRNAVERPWAGRSSGDS